MERGRKNSMQLSYIYYNFIIQKNYCILSMEQERLTFKTETSYANGKGRESSIQI